MLLAGSTDHYVTLNIDPELASGVSGHPTFLHGQGELFRQSFIYVPMARLDCISLPASGTSREREVSRSPPRTERFFFRRHGQGVFADEWSLIAAGLECASNWMANATCRAGRTTPL